MIVSEKPRELISRRRNTCLGNLVRSLTRRSRVTPKKGIGRDESSGAEVLVKEGPTQESQISHQVRRPAIVGGRLQEE